MARFRSWTRENKLSAAAIAIVALAVAGAGMLATARATDQPGFCRAACHEMAPYEQAWSQGPHAGVSCVECHVDAGPVARTTHKVSALREVAAHFAGETSFPMSDRRPIPDERCIRCHEEVASSTAGFDHAEHAKRGPCESCHRSVGHEVTDVALRAAGVFNPATKTQALVKPTATIDGGSANISGHVEVSCARCHDMAATGCASCHEPEHEDGGSAAKRGVECATCHEPAAGFAFTHPEVGEDCTTCHEAPNDHPAGACEDCHKKTGASWAFTHPRAKSGCVDCHERPAKHRKGDCQTCHTKTGKSWAFTHPKSSSTCTSCHDRPANHRAGSCVKCHRTGSSWSFAHPSGSSSCTGCHSRPSGHRSGSCTSCHTTGASWAFRHSSSSSCASCHKAPSNHFGSSCASCHSPSRSWSSASFSHPRIRGGEHSYRSFACTKCHPSGYSSYTCSRCHKSSTGPGDDDDDDDD